MAAASPRGSDLRREVDRSVMPFMTYSQKSIQPHSLHEKQVVKSNPQSRGEELGSTFCQKNLWT